MITYEKFYSSHHDFGYLGEARSGDDIDCFSIIPDISFVELNHNVERCLDCDSIVLLKHREHIGLQGRVQTSILVLGVDVFYVGDHILVDGFSQQLVLTAQQLEEQL